MEMRSGTSDRQTWWLLLGAWLVAAVASLGALFIGEVMGQTPCTLCWHQRAFMFPLAVVLLVASFVTDGSGVWRYALPVACLGWAIALYHNLLYFDLIESAIVPCGQGPSCSGETMLLLGSVPIPLLSLGAFSAIMLLLLLVQRRPTS